MENNNTEKHTNNPGDEGSKDNLSMNRRKSKLRDSRPMLNEEENAATTFTSVTDASESEREATATEQVKVSTQADDQSDNVFVAFADSDNNSASLSTNSNQAQLKATGSIIDVSPSIVSSNSNLSSSQQQQQQNESVGSGPSSVSGESSLISPDIDQSLREIELLTTELNQQVTDTIAPEQLNKIRKMLSSFVKSGFISILQDSEKQIQSLHSEIGNAWEIINTERERVLKQQEQIAGLRRELDSAKPINNASPHQATTSRGNNMEMHIQQDEKIRELTQTRKMLENRLEQIQDQQRQEQFQVEELENKFNHMLQERNELEIEVSALKELLGSKKSELDKEIRQRERQDMVLQQHIDVMAKKDEEIVTKMNEMRSLKENIQKTENTLKEEKIKMEKLEQEKDAVSSKFERVREDFDEQNATVTKLIADNQTQQAEIKNLETQIQSLKEDIRQALRSKDQVTRKMKAVEDSKLESDMERDKLKAELQNTVFNSDALKREIESLEKRLDSITKEKDVAQKNFVKATGATQKQLTMVRASEIHNKNLEQEINGYKEEASKMRKLIFSLEKDREKLMGENNRLENDRKEREELLNTLNMAIFDSKKKIADFEKKLKEQQSLYEGVRADRNLYSKNLIETQDEVGELRKKIKMMTHQIEQLKEEIGNKTGELNKNVFTHMKLEKEKDHLIAQIGKLNHSIQVANGTIQSEQTEQGKLKQLISEGENQRAKLKSEYDAVIQERDILGTQLVRRNDEIALLYEKIKIQTSALRKGEIQYRERLEDIRVLKLEIKRLRRERAILQTETNHSEALRNEIFKLQKEIMQERTRVKVLEEELESPMNIHRWRKLAGSDPSTFELLRKVQTLQRRLISKTEDVVEKELIIAQKDKLYNELKSLLQRQPGPEILEELRNSKEAIKIKVRECKSLASELNMYYSQINQYKYEIAQLNRDQQDLKKRYYDARRKLRKEEPFTSKIPSKVFGTMEIRTSKYLGGGFKVPDRAMIEKIAESIEQNPIFSNSGSPGAGPSPI